MITAKQLINKYEGFFKPKSKNPKAPVPGDDYLTKDQLKEWTAFEYLLKRNYYKEAKALQVKDKRYHGGIKMRIYVLRHTLPQKGQTISNIQNMVHLFTPDDGIQNWYFVKYRPAVEISDVMKLGTLSTSQVIRTGTGYTARTLEKYL